MFPQKDKILIVDDERYMRASLADALQTWGYKAVQASSAVEAKRIFGEEEPCLVLLDINLPDASGLDVLDEFTEANPETIVLMITANVSVDNAISALRRGAHDFLEKPVKLEELRVTLQNALETRNLRRNVRRVSNQNSSIFNFDEIISKSPAMKKAKELARRVATSDISIVLLQGESGTGKDLFAKAIHYASARAAAPFVAVNCATLPANLVESELFGHEKGSFTDAKQKKEGLIEQAEGGSLFLDEIGELDVSLQAKLLRVLEEKTFRRVGAVRDVPFDIRIIAATNRDLKKEAEAGHFRLDLYFRLSVVQIDLPPLRERGDDVLLLAQGYIDKLSRKYDKRLIGLTPEVAEIFRDYQWAGNVRELKNVIERAAIFEDGEFITTEFLPPDLIIKKTAQLSSGARPLVYLPPEGTTFEAVEIGLVLQALERADGNFTQAAKLLGVSRHALRNRLKKSGNYHYKFDENEA